MECPKCNSVMQLIDFQGVEVDRCSACGGLWFDTGEAEYLTSEWVSEFLDTGDAEVGERHDEMNQINCPRCGELMKNHFDLEKSQISFEVCGEHGKFFDAGEFTLWLNQNYLG
jgi:Zn-finger nucleic acid-binding protein